MKTQHIGSFCLTVACLAFFKPVSAIAQQAPVVFAEQDGSVAAEAEIAKRGTPPNSDPLVAANKASGDLQSGAVALVADGSNISRGMPPAGEADVWLAVVREPPTESKLGWQPVTSSDGSLPVKRHEAAYVGFGDKFYLAGGRRMNPVSIFDPAKNTWTQGAVPPVEIHHFQPVTHDGKIYFAGAMTGPYPAETPVTHLYTYDPTEDRWDRGPSLPVSRQRGSTGNVVYEGKLYLACGIRDGHRGDHKTWFDAYDLKTGQWEQLPDAPHARDHFQAAVCNDRLYLIGGRRSQAPTNTFGDTEKAVDVYDFPSGQWSTLAEGLPTPRAGNFLAVVGDEIFVFGGESMAQKVAHNEVEALNTKTHQWRTLPGMQQGRHGTGAIRFGDRIFVASGSGNRGGSPELTTHEMLLLQ